MRAAYYDEFGDASAVLQVGDLPDPSPAAGEVLVRMHASGVNPSDVKSRAKNSWGVDFSRIVPHSDGAGVIVAVGDGVGDTRVGQRVWLWNAQWKRPSGTAAQLIALPADQAVPLPGNVSFEVGACLGIPLITACRAVHWRPRARDGETMLVTGGAGAVGQYAVQIAKRAGYRVATTISSPEKAAIVRSLGADLIINYRTDDVANALADFTQGQGVDRIVEVNLAGNAQFYSDWLKPDGLAVVYGSDNWGPQLPIKSWLLHGIEVAIFIVYNLPTETRTAIVSKCVDLLADPDFKHMVGQTFALDEIVAAHEAVESGTVVGNVVISIP